jgi:hypothetical protein
LPPQLWSSVVWVWYWQRFVAPANARIVTEYHGFPEAIAVRAHRSLNGHLMLRSSRTRRSGRGRLEVRPTRPLRSPSRSRPNFWRQFAARNAVSGFETQSSLSWPRSDAPRVSGGFIGARSSGQRCHSGTERG